MLTCPVCAKTLTLHDKVAACENNHRFDIAREGYVNLLRSSKCGDKIGDDKIAARSRRDYLNKGYYALLCDALVELFAEKSGNVLDICCGEGYYTAALGMNPKLAVYGFDISKEMVRLGAKRGNATYFVANMAHIPAADESFDYAIHLFAPFQEKEFSRVLKQGGKLYTVVPGRLHLWGLKSALYDTPYENDEKLPEVQQLTHSRTICLRGNIRLETPEDIEAVFRMTPYYFHTSAKDKEKLGALQSLETEISFVIGEYIKEKD